MKSFHSSNAAAVPILVVGGTGKTGKRVVQGLRNHNIAVRVGSRTASPGFDWDNPATWAPALHGVRAVYLTYFPDLAVPQAPAAISNFCELARREGVEHIVLLSGRGEPAAQQCEQIVQASGMAWTIVRASWFNQNFSEGAFHDMVQTGTIALPVGNVGEPFVDADDIADVAIAALTQQGHEGQLYEVTGPRLLTFDDVATALSSATRSNVQFMPISVDSFIKTMLQQQVPKNTIDMMLFLFSEVLDGRNEKVCNGVQRALGRPAKDFSEYAASLPKAMKA